MPGKLIHTNEILVLLGDNWFVEKSSKQAVELIDRRIKGIDDNIDKFTKDKETLTDAIKWTKNIREVITLDVNI